MADVKALADTNILIDMVGLGRPESDAARSLLKLAAAGEAHIFVSAGSLKDFHYICRRDLPEKLRRDYISLFMDVFDILSLDNICCNHALASDEPDFEDGLIRAAAEQAGCKYVITRDVSAYKTSTCTKTSTAEFLRLLDEDRD